ASLLPLGRDSCTGLFRFSRAAVAAHDLCLLRVPGVLPSVAPQAKSLCRCRGTSSGPTDTLLRVAVLSTARRKRVSNPNVTLSSEARPERREGTAKGLVHAARASQPRSFAVFAAQDDVDTLFRGAVLRAGSICDPLPPRRRVSDVPFARHCDSHHARDRK